MGQLVGSEEGTFAHMAMLETVGVAAYELEGV